MYFVADGMALDLREVAFAVFADGKLVVALKGNSTLLTFSEPAAQRTVLEAVKAFMTK